jgi:Zn-dependent protease
MMPFHNLQFCSLPVGVLFGVPLRLSILIPIVAVAAAWRLQDPMSGMIVLLVLVFSVLLRELSHVLVWHRRHRRIGTVTLWPLGGVSSDPAISIKLRQALLRTLAGSVVSLGVAAVCGGYLFQNGLLTPGWMVPLRFPGATFADDLAIRCLQFSLLINWNLAILNLLPVSPLDGGQILQAWLSLRFRELVVRDIVNRTGMVLCIAGLIAGLVFDLSSVAALSGCLLLIMMDASRWLDPDLFAELEERMHQQNTYDEDDDDLFSRFRLDFHNKHTEEDGPRPSGNAFADRPTHSVSAEEKASETDQDAVDEANVDQILSKLHAFGRHSLTAQELAVLNRFSARLRQRKVRG